MARYLLQRTGLAVLSVWGVATLVFFLTKLIPGDAARIAAGRTATAEQVAAAAERLGLDKPVLQQYLDFLGRALKGDLGQSAATHQSVVHDLLLTVPITLELVVATMVITVLVSIPLGVVSAVHSNGGVDIATRIVLVVFGGVPVFLVGVLLQFGLSSDLGWFPISGTNTLGYAAQRVTGFTVIDSIIANDPSGAWDSLYHLILPAIVLSIPFIAVLARNVRSTMMGTLESDFVTFAVSKGVSRRRLVLHHALRASLASTITLFGMQINWMIGSALLVETVFALPGLGTYLSQAVLDQDTFAVLGAVIVIGTVGAIVSLVVDIVHLATDPRVRMSYLTGQA